MILDKIVKYGRDAYVILSIIVLSTLVMLSKLRLFRNKMHTVKKMRMVGSKHRREAEG